MKEILLTKEEEEALLLTCEGEEAALEDVDRQTDTEIREILPATAYAPVVEILKTLREMT